VGAARMQLHHWCTPRAGRRGHVGEVHVVFTALLSSIRPVQIYIKNIAWYFMPYGKKYSVHMPFGKGSGQ
jgi:hypothetical protein